MLHVAGDRNMHVATLHSLECLFYMLRAICCMVSSARCMLPVAFVFLVHEVPMLQVARCLLHDVCFAGCRMHVFMLHVTCCSFAACLVC
jgi:hypothetical protein